MLLLRFKGRGLSRCRLDWLTFGNGAILTLNRLTFHHFFFFDFVSLALLGLLLVFFTLLLRLHNVVHKVVEVLIIHLLVGVVVLGRLCIKLLPCALVVSPAGAFLLGSPRPLPRYAVKVVGDAVLGIAPTHAFSTRRLSLVDLKLVAVVKCLVAGGCCRCLVAFPCGAHLLLVLLLTLQLLLLLHELCARVLVQVEI
jgi:hypothetical protein